MSQAADSQTQPLPGANFQACLDKLHRDYKSLQAGKVADYIPELAKMSPDWFSICVATADGQMYQVGDADQLFTVQSISKVFAYGLALEDHGRDYLLSRVGVEPTGDAFNAIVLEEQTKRPYNPMVNAGAIATTSLIRGANPTERLNRMLDMFRRYVGHDVFIDMPTFVSERTTGHRNRAMAYLMRNFGVIDDSVDEALDLYFQQCSVMVSCRDLAVMAATLANHGVNPITGEQAVSACYTRDMLSIMSTCGMYNFAGEWIYKVGLPAKSGVSGGIIAIVPHQIGIAVFSPLLDGRGNSVRGVRVCEDLSQQFGLHPFDASMGCYKFLQSLAQPPDPNSLEETIWLAGSSTCQNSTVASPGRMIAMGSDNAVVKTLAVDIGGSGTKVLVLDESGHALTKRERLDTPQPATPEKILAAIAQLADTQGEFDRVSVGFPGVVRQGKIGTAANLDSSWIGFDLGGALSDLLGKPVRAANDADIQGLGAISGEGVELTITLGTGFGSALFVQGKLVPNLELGHHPFRKGNTYEEQLGRAALEEIGKKRWNNRLGKAIANLERLFNYDHLHIGGGETKNITLDLPSNASVVPNILGLMGGIALWRD